MTQTKHNTENAPTDESFIGKTVRYEFSPGALSACWNGKRIKGIGKVTDTDIAGGLEINNHLRIFQREVVEIIES